MAKNVLVPIADGSEELEAICIVDVLRRAGATVTLASVATLEVVASKGVKLIADRLLAECIDATYDLIALPGGMPGSEHLRDCPELVEALKRQRTEGRFYAAICAAPAVALFPHGLLKERRATCHPNFAQLAPGVNMIDAAVVVDNNCVTSRGAGTAVEFSLTLVELLYGKEKAREIARGMVFMRDW
jgi:4-methyl-5(b-hydroxyethyl)-thiazole monophosphate biosynthesis